MQCDERQMAWDTMEILIFNMLVKEVDEENVSTMSDDVFNSKVGTYNC